MKPVGNYYQILEAKHSSSRKEIRSSFRRLAKKYHPDTCSLDLETSHRKMFFLIEAYRVLGDDRKRASYDLLLSGRRHLSALSFRETLVRRSHEPHARVLLVFYDLLGGRGDEATDAYEKLRGETGRDPNPLAILGSMDYLDCLFLLGEAYQKRGRFADAVRQYEEALREDSRRHCLGRLRPEILQRIRDIYCRHLAREAEPTAALGYYSKLLSDIPISRKDRAFCHKKIAEALCVLGDRKRAQSHLQEALRLHAKLGGTKKLREKLKTHSA